MVRFAAIAACLALAPFAARGDDDVRTEAVYHWSRDVALQVSRSPNDFVLGVGGSPATIQAFLRLYAPDRSATLPLSNFRYFPEDEHRLAPPGVISYGPLTEEQERRLFEHFDRFVPGAEELGDRGLVLLDYSEHGGLFGVRFYLERYFAARGRAHEIAQVLITTPEKASRLRTAARAFRLSTRTTILPVEDPEVRGHLEGGHFSAHSEYSGLRVRAAGEGPPEPRPEFQRLLEWMARRAESDAGLPRPAADCVRRWRNLPRPGP